MSVDLKMKPSGEIFEQYFVIIIIGENDIATQEIVKGDFVETVSYDDIVSYFRNNIEGSPHEKKGILAMEINGKDCIIRCVQTPVGEFEINGEKYKIVQTTKY